MSDEVVLELVEEYIIDGEHRFKLRIKGTKLILNVTAENLEEAVKKAIPMIKSFNLYSWMESENRSDLV